MYALEAYEEGTVWQITVAKNYLLFPAPLCSPVLGKPVLC